MTEERIAFRRSIPILASMRNFLIPASLLLALLGCAPQQTAAYQMTQAYPVASGYPAYQGLPVTQAYPEERAWFVR